MVAATRPQRAYDHRLREFVHRSGSDRHAVGIAIPRSTLHSWKSRAPKPVVGLIGSDKLIGELESEVVRLTLQVRKLRCLLRLMLMLLKLLGFRLESMRLPEGKSKQRLLREVDRACQCFPLRKVLGMLRLSSSRYHAWVRKSECGLTDMPSCPKSNPSQLTLGEVSTIREPRATSRASASSLTASTPPAVVRISTRSDRILVTAASLHQRDWNLPTSWPMRPRVTSTIGAIATAGTISFGDPHKVSKRPSFTSARKHSNFPVSKISSKPP
jgi:hypothetical protein